MTSYTVQSGDSLSKIALRFYGNALKYPAIAQANGIASPYIIQPGQVLTIPNVAAPAPAVTTSPLSPFIARPTWDTAAVQGNTALAPSTFAQTFPAIPTQPAPASKPIVGHPGAPVAAHPTGFSLSSILANKKLLIGGAAVLALVVVASSGKKS